MNLDFFSPSLDAKFLLIYDEKLLKNWLQQSPFFFVIWNTNNVSVLLNIDAAKVDLEPDSIIFLTYNQRVKIESSTSSNEIKQLRIAMFNRSFYCVHTNDEAVSCNGLLFFGSDYLPTIKLSVNTKKKLNALFTVLTEEFLNKDTNQEEMLRILLKRWLILSVRIANQSLAHNSEALKQKDLLRQFNILVEEHFKTKHKVADYATLLFKSPKTLSNVFSKLNEKTPLQIIHQRITLEAKRLMLFSKLNSAEIARELNFESSTQFSKFFKNQTLHTPTGFKELYEQSKT